MALLYLSAIFFVISMVFLVYGARLEAPIIFGYLGVAILIKLPELVTKTFTKVSSKIYNAIAPPRRGSKACPRGLLFLATGGPPVCINEMDKLGGSRYTCPADKSKFVVVSCEPEFDGIV